MKTEVPWGSSGELGVRTRGVIMVDMTDLPILGPYALTRELTPYAAFADGIEPRAVGRGGQPTWDERIGEGGDGAGHSRSSPVVRSAAHLWRTMMSLGSGGGGAGAHQPGGEQSQFTSKGSVRVGAPKAMSGVIAPARFLALHLADQSSHVAYRFPVVLGEVEQSRVRSIVARAALLSHAHILTIERFMFDPAGHPWVITPYTGDVDGLRSLGRLLRDKHGQMPPIEAMRALMQILEASGFAHTCIAFGASGVPRSVDAPAPLTHHGVLTLGQVLVDRHGSLAIELYGLARALRSHEPSAAALTPEIIRDEIRSIVEIGYQLVTGLRAEAPWIPAGRLVRQLDPRWDKWFEHGLDPARGFDSAEEALRELPSGAAPVEVSAPRATVRSMWTRLRH